MVFTYKTTLIGFVRGARMNIYIHPYRIEVLLGNLLTKDTL
ncbi:MAG: hypothetical protein ACFFBP_04100 [Promethearchaeota archaeon]